MPLVDTHCHLTDPKFDEDRDAVIERALGTLDWLVMVSEHVANAEAVAALARPRVYAAVGVHPYHAPTLDDAGADRLRALSANPHVVAIGETGLDYYNEFAPRDAQRHAFERQLDLACELGLPVIVHNREADADTHALLRARIDRLPGCIMHCFGSDAEWARRFADIGCYISFAGNVAFKKAAPLREAAAAVPRARLLVEIDAPYLAPPPHRGKRCEPAFVEHTAAVLADVHGVPAGELAEQTTQNARCVFRVNG